MEASAAGAAQVAVGRTRSHRDAVMPAAAWGKGPGTLPSSCCRSSGSHGRAAAAAFPEAFGPGLHGTTEHQFFL